MLFGALKTTHLKKKLSLGCMLLLYITAGVYHFIKPELYISIMPPWLPFHLALVYISGAAEILLAVLLMFSSTRRIAAWGIVALLIAVFPANIQMLLQYLHTQHPHTWMAFVRLPLQLLLISWAYSFT